MSNAQRLAHRIAALAPNKPDLLTHLKLQKLAFYGFGACLAFDLDDEIGRDVTFEAWEHGPVCRPIWADYHQFGSNPLGPFSVKGLPYSARVEKVLKQAVDIYGLLPAWRLREESHLEEPWKRAWLTKRPLSNDVLRAHFAQKFRTGPVRLPTCLVNAQSAALDGIPAQDYGSFDRLAQVARSLDA